MSFKESVITDWKYKTMEYQGKKLWIAEQFEYEGREYLFCIDEESFDKEIFDVVFLYKVKDDIFANVSDDKLHDELIGAVGGIMAKEQILKIKKEYDLK